MPSQRVLGRQAADKAFQKLTGLSADALFESLREVGKQIRRDARSAVPVSGESKRNRKPRKWLTPSGTLKKSIKIRGSRPNLRVIVGTFGAEAFYAAWVEFGTSRSRAQPYMGPAYERNKGDVPRHFRTGFAKNVKKVEIVSSGVSR